MKKSLTYTLIGASLLPYTLMASDRNTALLTDADIERNAQTFISTLDAQGKFDPLTPNTKLLEMESTKRQFIRSEKATRMQQQLNDNLARTAREAVEKEQILAASARQRALQAEELKKLEEKRIQAQKEAERKDKILAENQQKMELQAQELKKLEEERTSLLDVKEENKKLLASCTELENKKTELDAKLKAAIASRDTNVEALKNEVSVVEALYYEEMTKHLQSSIKAAQLENKVGATETKYQELKKLYGTLHQSYTGKPAVDSPFKVKGSAQPEARDAKPASTSAGDDSDMLSL